MKKGILIIGLLVIFILVGITGIVVFKYIQNKSKNDFVLVKETGNVYYKKPDDTDYQLQESVEMTLPSGSFVKTDTESYARVFLPNNSLISIDQSTEVQISCEDKNTNINQLVGKTWNRVQNLSGQNTYEVKTPNVTAAVRGTIFAVDVDNNDLSRVYVIDSNVEINRYELVNNQKKILETQTLSKEDFALIIRDTTSFRIEKNKIDQNTKDSFWYLRNVIIDEEFNKLEGRKGKIFRNMLNEKLKSREEYRTYLFGLSPESSLTKEQIESELSTVSDITKVDEQTCVKYTLTDFQLAIDKVDEYKIHIKNYDNIRKLLLLLKKSCADGEMSQTESEEIEILVNKINQNIGN